MLTKSDNILQKSRTHNLSSDDVYPCKILHSAPSSNNVN